MTETHKKPGWAFWATVVVVLVLAYPLSFGPACWMTTVDVSRPGGPRYSKAMIAYWPLGAVADGDGQAARVLQWWMGLGAGTERFTFVPTNPSGTHAAGFRGDAKVSSMR